MLPRRQSLLSFLTPPSLPHPNETNIRESRNLVEPLEPVYIGFVDLNLGVIQLLRRRDFPPFGPRLPRNFEDNHPHLLSNNICLLFLVIHRVAQNRTFSFHMTLKQNYLSMISFYQIKYG